jgi:hypothetical protein
MNEGEDVVVVGKPVGGEAYRNGGVDCRTILKWI